MSKPRPIQQVGAPLAEQPRRRDVHHDDRPTLRRWSVGLLVCTGVGQIVCGIFNLEASMPHTLGFGLAAGTPVVAFLVAGQYLRRVPGWRRLGTGLLFGSPLTLALLVGFFATFQPTADGAEHGIAGLMQRLLVLQIQAWIMAIGWRAYRGSPATIGESTVNRAGA